MSCVNLNGKELSQQIKDQLRLKVNSLKVKPTLAVIIVGSDPASNIYVANKEKSCLYVGISSIVYRLPSETTETQLLDKIEQLNTNKTVTGILVQMPLPTHINPDNIVNAIDPKKDVDCFNPINVGNLFLGQNTKNAFLPCTPGGIITILKNYNIQISGKTAVVVGRSNIVGKPMAALLTKENATVTLCHSKTENLESFTKTADILVCAIGKPNFITPNMIKEGCTLIDVGMNRLNGKLCGDINPDCASIAGAMTPVPGGVGPMTIATLLQNVLIYCLRD